MPRLLVVVLLAALVQACASQPSAERSDLAARRFTDAAQCVRTAEIKERVQLPSGTATTVVEITLSYDAGAFAACMERAGHAAPRADPGVYLTVARRCVKEADGAANREAAYGDCVRQSKIIVEAVPEGEAE